MKERQRAGLEIWLAAIRVELAILMTVILAFQSALVVIYEIPNKSNAVVLAEIVLIVLGAICIALLVVIDVK